MHFAERHRVDGDKIETVEDVAKIIDALDIRVAPDHDAFEDLKPYLSEINGNQQDSTYD